MIEIPKWPEYQTGPEDSIFALGVVSINFANFERAQIWIFASVSAMPEEGARMVHARIGAQGCNDLISLMIARRTDWPSEPVDLVRHFVTASRILITNRNLLMHSVMTAGWEGKAALYRTGRQGQRLMLSASSEQIRAVADNLLVYFEFGWMLANRIAIEVLKIPAETGVADMRAWPDKPPLPNPLE